MNDLIKMFSHHTDNLALYRLIKIYVYYAQTYIKTTILVSQIFGIIFVEM